MSSFGGIRTLTVFALDDYASLPDAMTSVRKLRTDLLGQGFVEMPHSTESRFKANFGSARHTDTLDEIEEAFLDSQFFAQRGMALDMTKKNLRVTVTLLNGRRLWGDSKESIVDMMLSAKTRAAAEAAKFTRHELAAEPSYSLEVSIGDNPYLRK